jgi:hypothetical protein
MLAITNAGLPKSQPNPTQPLQGLMNIGQENVKTFA